MESSTDPRGGTGLVQGPPRKRPRSQGSTASIRSVATQPSMDPTYAPSQQELYSAHWISSQQNHPQARELTAIAPMPNNQNMHQNNNNNNNMQQQQQQSQPQQPQQPDNMMLRAASVLQESSLQAAREFSVDAQGNPGGITHHGLPQQHHPYLAGRQSVSAMSVDSFTGNGSFADDSQMMEGDGNEEGNSFASANGTGSRPANRSSANNEHEMRQLFQAHKHRTLQDVAEELHGNERGPNSERTRQVFAMLWISQTCTKGKGSVPRGRVYSNYAFRCGNERIQVLNPASFGKLVRVLFPGLKTRRLGVRGESKYHYVNFTLLEEQPGIGEAENTPPAPVIGGPTTTSLANFNTAPTQPPTLASRPPERAVFPTAEIAPEPDQPVPVRSQEFPHSRYNQPHVVNYDQIASAMGKTSHKLRFVQEQGGVSLQEPLALPSIEPFLPSGTDSDAARSLTALYRAHCTSLVECIRYCKEKTFFHLFTSFQGTLTMPVQKLFGNPALAPWIEECDFVLYQRMMRIVSSLSLQVVPKPVLDTLRNIAERLVPHIRESFQDQPLHVVRAKEAPAAIFASLLERALRVNLTAHAAANMLSNPANRDLMYLEFITMVYPLKIAEYVPTRGMDDVVYLLLNEMRGLLDPIDIPWDIEKQTLYGDYAIKTGRIPQPKTTVDSTVANVLDRWVSFLYSLPERFPYASHTDIVLFVQRIGTAVMRDLTISQGKSFGSWWVTKCWIDEMIQFLAEQGGFMGLKTTHGLSVPKQRQPAMHNNSNSNNAAGSRQGSRYSSGSDDFNLSAARMSQSQMDKAQFPNPSTVTQNGQDGLATGNPNHDDSGIGIRTPDEDLPPMGKYEFTPNTAQFLNTGL